MKTIQQLRVDVASAQKKFEDAQEATRYNAQRYQDAMIAQDKAFKSLMDVHTLYTLQRLSVGSECQHEDTYQAIGGPERCCACGVAIKYVDEMTTPE